MPNYRRANFPGGYYFFTVVTYKRRRLFNQQQARRCFRQAVIEARTKYPFEMIAFCLMPDHLHCIWKLPEADSDFSIRWSYIKGKFSRDYGKLIPVHEPVSLSRAGKSEVAVWQRRFWEHQIRDENDLQKHIDYIHYNPVKHRLVNDVSEWLWSTYRKYLKDGFYKHNHDFSTLDNISNQMSFGE